MYNDPCPFVFSEYDIDALSYDLSVPLDIYASCNAMLHQQLDFVSHENYLLCKNLDRFISVLQEDERLLDLANKEVGPIHFYTQLSMANIPNDMRTGFYWIIKKLDIPVFRVVTIKHSNHQMFLRILLSPLGFVMGGFASHDEVLSVQENYMLKNRSWYFDGNFQAFDFSAHEKGSRKIIQDAATLWLDAWYKNSPASSMLTDGAFFPVDASVRAMIIDGSVDSRVEGLSRRFALHPQAVRDFVRDGVIQEPLFFGGHYLIDAYKQLVMDSSEQSQHGTQVASLLMANLPNAQLTFMSADFDELFTDTNLAIDFIGSAILHNKPAVVNISWNYMRTVQDCENIFGSVFRHFENEVLFVVGAGNDWSRNSRSACPGAMSHNYINVISVAGVGEDYKLAPFSNYGADIVDIAAPSCANTMMYQDGTTILKRGCGTSFAAPVVANAALRLLGQSPKAIKPRVLKDLLMSACDDSGIDVACGGALDHKRLETVFADYLAKL